jgi:hypothetical protein
MNIAILFALVAGSISLDTLRTAKNTKSKVGYFIGFGSLSVTGLLVSALVIIGLKVG